MIGEGVNHVVGTGRKACVRYVPWYYWWVGRDLNSRPTDKRATSALRFFRSINDTYRNNALAPSEYLALAFLL